MDVRERAPQTELRHTVDADAVLRPLLSCPLREATDRELCRTVRREVSWFIIQLRALRVAQRLTRGTIRGDRTRAENAAAEALLNHLLCGCDVCIHETEDVEPYFVFDEPSALIRVGQRMRCGGRTRVCTPAAA